MAKKISKLERESVNYQILAMMRKGMSNLQIVKHISETRGVGRRQAYNYLNKAYRFLNEHTDKICTQLRIKQTERYEALLELAIEKGDLATANKILANIDKLLNLQTNKVELTGNSEIKIDFGFGKNEGDEDDVEDDED